MSSFLYPLHWRDFGQLLGKGFRYFSMASRSGNIFLGSHLHGNSIMMRFEPNYPGQKLTLKPFDNASILPAVLVKFPGSRTDGFGDTVLDSKSFAFFISFFYIVWRSFVRRRPWPHSWKGMSYYSNALVQYELVVTDVTHLGNRLSSFHDRPRGFARTGM